MNKQDYINDNMCMVCQQVNSLLKGYIIIDNRALCYNCAYEVELKQIRTNTKHIGYLAYDIIDGKKYYRITNWVGKKIMEVTTIKTINSFAGTLQSVQCKDFNGNRWYGKGLGGSMYIRLHKAKA